MKFIIIFDDVYIGFLMNMSKINEIERINEKSVVFFEDKSKEIIKNNTLFKFANYLHKSEF